MSRKKALIVEDHPLMATALADEFVSAMGEGSVALAASSLEEALTTLAKERFFDCVIIDPGLPDVPDDDPSKRIDLVKKIVANLASTTTIVVTTGAPSEVEASKLSAIGVHAYMSKAETNAVTIKAAVRNQPLPEGVPQQAIFSTNVLTPRQLEVYRTYLTLKQGKPNASNEELIELISTSTQVNYETTRSHLYNALKKLK
ncbi:response regulator [Epibacterium ulvae]|uniref:response regulator n=1 Tax=Epibacterium ulvae TaxID=1156985 RepID=UPI002490D811|nr:response regulator [Epibacterium ulvae]